MITHIITPPVIPSHDVPFKLGRAREQIVQIAPLAVSAIAKFKFRTYSSDYKASCQFSIVIFRYGTQTYLPSVMSNPVFSLCRGLALGENIGQFQCGFPLVLRVVQNGS